MVERPLSNFSIRNHRHVIARIVANLARPRFRCLAPQRPRWSYGLSASELAAVCARGRALLAYDAKRGASQHHDCLILCVSCSPIRWSSSRAKSVVGEVSESCYSTGSGLCGASAEVTPGAVKSPGLFSGPGAWVLVMCIGVVSRER